MDYAYTIKRFAEAIKPEILSQVIPKNNGKHTLIITAKGKKYYLLHKRAPFIFFDDVFQNEQSRGMADSINKEWLNYCLNKKINIDKICFIYDDKSVYVIDPKELEKDGKVRETKWGEITVSIPISSMRRIQ